MEVNIRKTRCTINSTKYYLLNKIYKLKVLYVKITIIENNFFINDLICIKSMSKTMCINKKLILYGTDGVYKQIYLNKVNYCIIIFESSRALHGLIRATCITNILLKSYSRKVEICKLSYSNNYINDNIFSK